MQRHVEERHQSHVREADNKEHQEWNGGVILIHKSIKHDQGKICAEAQLKQGHHARAA